MFQVTVIPYFKSNQNEILYATVLSDNQFCPLQLTGNGQSNETILQAGIRIFAELTGMYLNPIRFQQLMCFVSIPITEIQEHIIDENILMIPRYYIAVHLPHKITSIDSQQITFGWVPQKTLNEQFSFQIDKFALWELDTRLKLDKTDILPNQQQTRPKNSKRR